ncbi:PTS sugar transporter subunit IIB [Anaerorhabdus sp.]|uniref:PTS sugar transporter subunit IIB n=1 Tax=Anaerorhabdus sp. TaxID=1872524 RepID=UPI002B21F6FE|nr:PTS sugar transporter subunit IIB [Anaerorhabdus sp.]MEA4876143.1 PTS sugar transporter subunit IIB [Anaerorhabdus sp.]
MKELKVLSVCGMGFGTSLMLFMTIQDIGKKYDIKITGEACDLGSYKGKPCDLIVASSEIAQQIKSDDIPVLGISNLLDKNDIEEKIKQYFN